MQPQACRVGARKMLYPGLKDKADRWYRSGKSLKWQGNDIFYRDFGAGPPLLLVHGFPTAGCDWDNIAAVLSRHFRLLVPDLVDYGRSRNNTGKRYHIHDQADMIEALLQHAGVSAVHIVAHNVGDTVCQELLARHNEGALRFGIESLVLMNGGILPAEHRARPIQKLLLSPVGPLVAMMLGPEKFTSAIAEVFAAGTRPDHEARMALWEISVGVNGRRSFARRIHYMSDRRQHERRWVSALQQTNVKMLMINGVDDPVSGAHACDAIETEIPAMAIVRLTGIGHFPPIEAPAQCTEHILAFHDLPATSAGDSIV